MQNNNLIYRISDYCKLHIYYNAFSRWWRWLILIRYHVNAHSRICKISPSAIYVKIELEDWYHARINGSADSSSIALAVIFMPRHTDRVISID